MADLSICTSEEYLLCMSPVVVLAPQTSKMQQQSPFLAPGWDRSREPEQPVVPVSMDYTGASDYALATVAVVSLCGLPSFQILSRAISRAKLPVSPKDNPIHNQPTPVNIRETQLHRRVCAYSIPRTRIYPGTEPT